MPLAHELIDFLAQNQWVEDEVIDSLRRQVNSPASRQDPAAMLQLLVDNGQMTAKDAAEALAQFQSQRPIELLEDDIAEAQPVDADFDDGEPAEAIAVAEVFDDGFDDAEPVEAIAVEAAPYGDGGEDEPTRPRRRPADARPQRSTEKSTWDSFKIYGYAGIIGFLVLAGGGLAWTLNTGSADDAIELANEKYNGQSYEQAQEAYATFLTNFGPDNKHSTLARTRIEMAKLYRAAQMTDPAATLQEEQKILPGLVDEEGLNTERGNLAALLVDVAAKMATEASEATETAEKQRLLGVLDEQLRLIEDPNYMMGSMKTTLAGQLAEIAESRGRVKREINRNIRLDEAVAAMTASIDAKDTKAAYDTRQTLLRDFPELSRDDRLNQLILAASELQQTLVAPAVKVPTVTTEAAGEDAGRSIVLTSRDGDTAPVNGEEGYYLRAGGSVLAFAVDDGRLLWRKFTGYGATGVGTDHLPQRIAGGSAVLLSDLTADELRRVDGETGATQWRVAMEEPFAEPHVGRGAIYVSTPTGRVTRLDESTGEPAWAVTIPQDVEISPGVHDPSGTLYQPGGHSNLYVLDARDGQCRESFYVGHAAGTIAVAPQFLLGQLFVIENRGTDYSLVHVLAVNDQGGDLKQAQDPFRLAGNVVVPPIVDKNRIVVLTDLGEVSVLDVEVTATGDKVTRIATQPASTTVPTSTRMAVDSSQAWIAGNRIGRFELQISQGRIVPDWGLYDGDTFIGQPTIVDGVLLHARMLRGTSAIRVTAARPKTGETIWSTDVGTPVTMITPVPGGGAFHAVTSLGALFKLDGDALASGSTSGPVENPGSGGITMRYVQPVRIDDQRVVFINQARPTELMVYDPTRRNQLLRKVTMRITGGEPTGQAVVSGGGVFLPLDSGRAVLMNYQTGAVEGSPFQPPSDPSQKVTWSQPVVTTDDPDQVILGDSRKKLYRLRVGKQLRDLASADLEQPLLGPAAGVADAYVATVSGPSSDFLIGFDQASLKQKFRQVLDGRVVWGPVAVTRGDQRLAVVKTDDGRLRLFSAAGEAVGTIEMPSTSDPVGEILVEEDRWLLALADGSVVAMDPTGGQPAELSLGQPLSATPLVASGRLLVPGSEGVIYITEVPGA